MTPLKREMIKERSKWVYRQLSESLTSTPPHIYTNRIAHVSTVLFHSFTD